MTSQMLNNIDDETKMMNIFDDKINEIVSRLIKIMEKLSLNNKKFYMLFHY